MPPQNTASSSLSVDEVRTTHVRIRSHIVRTPTLESEVLSKEIGSQLFIKYENMQHTGAFKARGAIAKLSTLTEGQKASGVVAMSAGNHAQGVAYFAAKLRIPATIVMPVGTPFLKVRKTQNYGATVILQGENFSEATKVAEGIARGHGLTLVHPYDDEQIIAGQGTIGLEIIEDAPDLDAIVIPVGGGGLIAGIALAVSAANPRLEIIGVEAGRYPAMINALEGTNRPCSGATVAEGIAVSDVGATTIPIVRSLVQDIVTVSEEKIEAAIAMFAVLDKTVAEGAGAAPLAAVLDDPRRFKGRRVGLVLSGGNIDARLLSSVLMRGLVRSGQVLTMDIEMSDRPGQLSAVSSICAAQRANVLDVSHSRFALDLSASSARLAVTIETRDARHAQEVVNDMRLAGYRLTMRGALQDNCAAESDAKRMGLGQLQEGYEAPFLAVQ